VRATNLFILGLALAGCHSGLQEAPPPAASTEAATPSPYFDHAGRKDTLAGGVRMIPIKTPKGEFHVWTKRVGNNPRIKVLLLHGGPAATHEYFEALDSYFPAAGVEYYFYDQLGSAYSDQPTDQDLWQLPRFVDEVEQVRIALGLNRDNFYLLGHSWGGMLATEYALAHQQEMKGLIISNMMASIPAYNEYANKTLMPAMDQKALAAIKRFEATGKTEDPGYMALLMPHHYEKHILRMPGAEWPDPVLRAFKHLNTPVYALMQGPSELGASGRLVNWDRFNDLAKITVPTLVVGARYDTMDPHYMEWMSKQFPKGQYLYCPNGSHLALYDDQKTWFSGIIGFVEDVDKK
jgi:proline iminopeptidase